MTTGINTEVTLEGNLFERPKPVLDYHIHLMSKELAQDAQIAIKFQGQSSFRYERSRPTGAWSRSIKVRVTSAIGGLKGAEVHDSGIVYGPWLEGVGSRNFPVTRFKGYSTFRKVRQEIERKAPNMLTSQTRRMAKDLER